MSNANEINRRVIKIVGKDSSKKVTGKAKITAIPTNFSDEAFLKKETIFIIYLKKESTNSYLLNT